MSHSYHPAKDATYRKITVKRHDGTLLGHFINKRDALKAVYTDKGIFLSIVTEWELDPILEDYRITYD